MTEQDGRHSRFSWEKLLLKIAVAYQNLSVAILICGALWLIIKMSAWNRHLERVNQDLQNFTRKAQELQEILKKRDEANASAIRKFQQSYARYTAAIVPLIQRWKVLANPDFAKNYTSAPQLAAAYALISEDFQSLAQQTSELEKTLDDNDQKRLTTEFCRLCKSASSYFSACSNMMTESATDYSRIGLISRYVRRFALAFGDLKGQIAETATELETLNRSSQILEQRLADVQIRIAQFSADAEAFDKIQAERIATLQSAK